MLSPLRVPQAWRPSAWRTARAHAGSGSATSAPTACPPACSHASTTTKRAGNDAGAGTLHPQFGAFAAQFGFWHNQEINNSSCTLPLALSAAHRPNTFFKKHKKTCFIKTNGRLGASPPEWVCIAKGAAGVPAQPRPQGRLPGGAGAAALWYGDAGVMGGLRWGAAPSLAALGLLAGRRLVQVALVACDVWKEKGVGGGQRGAPRGGTQGGGSRGYSRTVSPILRALPRSSSASTLLSKVSAATRKKKSRTFSPAPRD